jgi:hypothetical protein
MLPKIYSENYQEFLNLLLKMQQKLVSEDLEQIKEFYSELQDQFTAKIMILTGTELEGANYHNWQRLQTEIHRSFKLLETQLILLSVSRNPITNQKYLTQINNYLNNLISYCKQIIKD